MKVKENLIKRSLTGCFLVLIAIVWMFLGAIYLSGIFGSKPAWSAYSFMAVNTFLLLVAMFEIINLRKALKWNFWIKALIFFMALVFLWIPIGNENFGPYIYNKEWFSFWITLLVYLFFIVIFFIIRFTSKNFMNEDLLFVFFWTFYLVFVFKGVNFLMLQSKGFKQLGWPTFAYLWVIILSTDVGAYFGGSLWGKKLLAPNLSPKKTWEGAITGFVLAVVFSMILVILLLELGNYNPLPIYHGLYGKILSYVTYLGISCILSFICQIGDLFFSYLKRNHNVKDFGNIFPGHGGLLDRLDGFSLVILFVYFFTFLLL